MAETEWDTEAFLNNMMTSTIEVDIDAQQAIFSSWKTKYNENVRMKQEKHQLELEKREREEAENRKQQQRLLVCTFRVPGDVHLAPKEIEQQVRRLLECHGCMDVDATFTVSTSRRNMGIGTGTAHAHSHLGVWDAAQRDMKIIIDPSPDDATFAFLHALMDWTENYFSFEMNHHRGDEPMQVFVRTPRRADAYKDF